MDLFVENKLTPEKFSTFWDNIHIKKGIEDKATYAETQCNNLKLIKIENMEVEFKSDGLYIKDKTDPDICAVLDYRDSSHGEFRGQRLKEALTEYAKSHQEGMVYDALTNMIHSHYHPTFSGSNVMKLIQLTAKECQSIVFKVIDNIMNRTDKLESTNASRHTKEWVKKNDEAQERFPQFLHELDKENIEELKQRLKNSDFINEKFSDLRENAIQKLLDYRNTLFEETGTTGINLKDSRKASKCHFSEQMINVLVNNEPQPNQTFKAYVENCIKTAESKLTPDEVKDWPKGVFSNRLLDAIKEIKEMKSSLHQGYGIGNSDLLMLRTV